MLGLVSCDDRAGAIKVELVIESDLDLVLVDLTVPVEECARGQQSKIVFPEAAEIRIAILGKDRPIVGDGILDAAADRPADAGVRKVAVGEERIATVERPGVCERHVGFEAAERDAAGRVDQGAVPSDAELAANRSLNI